MNPLYQQLNQPTTFKQFVNMFKNSANPQAMLNQLVQNNPQLMSVYMLLQSSKKAPKELFYELAQQKGIDPNSVLEFLK